MFTIIKNLCSKWVAA